MLSWIRLSGDKSAQAHAAHVLVSHIKGHRLCLTPGEHPRGNFVCACGRLMGWPVPFITTSADS